jgi:hypothetical protein
LDFAQSHISALAIDENGQVMFVGCGDEMGKLLSLFSEFTVGKREWNGCKDAYLISYFNG